MRPYHSAYHPRTWRQWWDFGNGMMGDRGVHTFDPVVSALQLGAPTSVDATTCGNTKEVHPLSAIVTFQFPARGNLPPVKLTWFEGTRPPRPAELDDSRKFPAEGGSLIKGSKGTIMAGVYGDSPRIIPEKKMQEVAPTIKSLWGNKKQANIHGGAHEQNWIHACKSGTPAVADFAYSAPLTEICLLGNIAQRVDARINWDAANVEVTNLPDANKYIRCAYRKGWSL
jgi:predicted dehydrogenase